MTISFPQPPLCAALLAVAMLTACSRPVAYVHRGPADPSATFRGRTVVIAVPVPRPIESVRSLAQVSRIGSSAETYVRQDNRVATSKTLSKRMTRMGKILASPTETRRSEVTSAPHKLSGLERLVLRKMNRQISHQLAPAHPEKVLVKKGKLAGSLILLIAGLLMLILGTGTLAFIGLIVGLVGAVGTVISLFGIDS